MAIRISAIRRLLRARRYSISRHAFEEAFADGLEMRDIVSALRGGEIIEEYPERGRCLTLGFTSGGVAVHVVCELKTEGHLRIVTVYVPSPDEWADYTVRRG